MIKDNKGTVPQAWNYWESPRTWTVAWGTKAYAASTHIRTTPKVERDEILLFYYPDLW